MKESADSDRWVIVMAEARSALTLESFFGSAADRTRSKSGGIKRKTKAFKEVVAKKSKQQVQDGMREADFTVSLPTSHCFPLLNPHLSP